MALTERYSEGPSRIALDVCVVGKHLKQLDEEEAGIVDKMLADEDWPLLQILGLIREEYPERHWGSYASWSRHRRGQCACYGRLS